MKEHEAAVSVADLRRNHGVSNTSIYKWKAKWPGVIGSQQPAQDATLSRPRMTQRRDFAIRPARNVVSQANISARADDFQMFPVADFDILSV